MRFGLKTAALVAVLALAGCPAPEVSAQYTGSSGTLAISRDDALLYAAQTDSDTVAVVDAATGERLATVAVGKAPVRITVGPDDTIYVANRGSRSVSVIKRGRWEEAARVEVGVEPAALQVSGDNATLYVVNSTSLSNADVGTLSAVDVATLQMRWELEVGHEPRGLALVDGGRTALVSLLKEGDVVRVDLDRQQVVQRGTRAYDFANASRDSADGISTFHARGMGDLAVAEKTGVFGQIEFERVFAPVIWAREDEILTPPNAFGGYYANGGPCNTGSISAAGLLTFEGFEAKADDLTSCTGASSAAPDFPSTLLGTFEGRPMQGPVAVVTSPTGDHLWVLNRETRNLAVMRTDARTLQPGGLAFQGGSVRDLVDVGHGADGLALSRDGSRAFVHNQFDHSITRIEQLGSGAGSRLHASSTFRVGEESLPAEIAQGRRLFHDAADAQLSSSVANVACTSCHFEGRDDGHVWRFPDGPRQTPSMAGRMLSQTAPFHWSGEFADLDAFFDHTVRLRMGGQGLSGDQMAQMMAYLDWLPTPDNPHRLEQPSETQRRGAAVFAKAGCDGCHSGQAFTDNSMQDVGTLVGGDTVSQLNVPSLLTLARTGPYLHDGSAVDLKDRLLQSRALDTHGDTSRLTDVELDELVAYLRSL